MTPLYYISMYTDGPSTLWNVNDGSSHEWLRRFATQEQAQAYADKLTTIACTLTKEEEGDDGQPDEMQEWSDYDRDC